MNCNHFQKVVHSALWFGNRIALSKILKDCYHKNYWSDSGGKVEENESLIEAVQRETYEETDLSLERSQFKLIDCYIYPERELKTFLFEVNLCEYFFTAFMKNREPEKHFDWKLFTVEEALKLKKLMPSVRFYLEGLKSYE